MSLGNRTDMTHINSLYSIKTIFNTNTSDFYNGGATQAINGASRASQRRRRARTRSSGSTHTIYDDDDDDDACDDARVCALANDDDE